MPPNPENHPHVVIVGAGFGGLACAQALGGKPVRVTIVDRRNYHLFVPLLYQVATAALSPADIARPIRRILGRYENIEVVLGNVTGIDTAARRVRLARTAASLPMTGSWSRPAPTTPISAIRNGRSSRPGRARSRMRAGSARGC